MLITIWGKAGAGKSTCTWLLAERLWYTVISIGDMKRKLAESRWISIQEFNELGELPENRAEFDEKYEEFQKSVPLTSKVILDSRLSYWCQPKAFNIFLDVDETIAAQRIREANRSTDNHGTLEATLEENRKRTQGELSRYMQLYQTNPQDLTNYDLVIDTTRLTPDQVVEKIIARFEDYIS
jgi:cytidylate kinase